MAGSSYDRRDYKTAIPQLSSKMNEILDNNVQIDKKVVQINTNVNELNTDHMYFKNLTTGYFQAIAGDIEHLSSREAYIQNLKAETAEFGYLDVDELEASYAQIDAANINTAQVRSAWIDQVMVQSGLIAHEGTIYELDAIQVNASKIKTGTLDVERLIVSVPDQQDPTKIHKYMVHVDPTTGTPSYEKVDADVLEDLTITADKIVAGAITAEKITTENIVGSGGWINLRNGTFNYVNATTGNGISWDGQHLNIRANAITMGTSQQTLEQILEGMQSEIDGAIETWYEAVDPLPDATHPNDYNIPASTWTTSEQKNNHLRDLYFNTETGHSYRWAQVGTSYYWVQIEDADAIKALADAAAAQRTADSANALAGAKRRVFVVTPTPPYDVGDLWMQGAEGDIMKCKFAKADGTSYSASDWEKAAKYTDDSNVYTKAEIDVKEGEINSAVSAKADGASTTAALSLKANKDTLTSEINASADTVQINANRVNIEGAAIFTGTGRLSQTSLDDTYDANGAASDAVSDLTTDLASATGTTVINGGHIQTDSLSAISANMGTLEAGKIQKGNNFINLDTSPASMEFKNGSTWANATQGLQFDTQGNLRIKGNVEITSSDTIPTKTELETAVNNIEGLNVHMTTSGSNLIFNAILIRGGEDITSDIPDGDFEWFHRTPTGDEWMGLNGKTITIPQTQQEYGRTIMCVWSRNQYANLLTNAGNKLKISTGNYLVGRSEY